MFSRSHAPRGNARRDAPRPVAAQAGCRASGRRVPTLRVGTRMTALLACGLARLSSGNRTVGDSPAHRRRNRCIHSLDAAPQDLVQLEIVGQIVVAEIHAAEALGAIRFLRVFRIQIDAGRFVTVRRQIGLIGEAANIGVAPASYWFKRRQTQNQFHRPNHARGRVERAVHVRRLQ